MGLLTKTILKKMDLTDKIQVYNEDCMETMSRYKDNYFDLAIVDPPYGIKRAGQRKEVYKGKKAKHNKKYYKFKDWDSKPPPPEYFKELKRVSKDQIIWGANYFIEHLTSSSCFIFWDKGQKLNQADGELAYCSIQSPIRSININRCFIAKEGGAIHPTQKPVKLYSWILEKYARPDFKIIDTHLGSGSNAISCYNYGCELVASELDPEHFNDFIKRFKSVTAQLKLF